MNIGDKYDYSNKEDKKKVMGDYTAEIISIDEKYVRVKLLERGIFMNIPIGEINLFLNNNIKLNI